LTPNTVWISLKQWNRRAAAAALAGVAVAGVALAGLGGSCTRDGGFQENT